MLPPNAARAVAITPLRCMLFRRGPEYIAECVDLNISRRWLTAAGAEIALESAIREYIRLLLGGAAAGLPARKSPWHRRLRYWLGWRAVQIEAGNVEIDPGCAAYQLVCRALNIFGSEVGSLDMSSRNASHNRLTPKELAVLGLFLLDLPLKEIGCRLGTDIRTVSFHKRNVMAKLGLVTDFQLHLYGIVHGLVANPLKWMETGSERPPVLG